MNRNVYIEEINTLVNTIETKELKEIINFISFVKFKEQIDPTVEILSNEKFYESLIKGIQDKKENKVYDWNAVK